MLEERQVWKLRNRPTGMIADYDLDLVSEPIPTLEPCQVLVATDLISLDASNRLWMAEVEQYMPPVQIGAPMLGGVAGRVIASKSDAFPEGMIVSGLGEWATHSVIDDHMISPLSVPEGIELATWFGSLGGAGWTAFFGLFEVCRPKSGETLVVSAAAGSVGSLVGQMAKIAGAKVIGIAGGPDKCAYLVDELGFDAAIDYRNEDVGTALDKHAPDGIDISFENVGGEIMNEVTKRLRMFGRMALCGMISTYNEEDSIDPPAYWHAILMRRLTIRGFIVSDFVDRFGEASAKMAEWHKSGRLKTREDIRLGLENAVTSVRDLYTGGNHGKLLLKVS